MSTICGVRRAGVGGDVDDGGAPPDTPRQRLGERIGGVGEGASTQTDEAQGAVGGDDLRRQINRRLHTDEVGDRVGAVAAREIEDLLSRVRIALDHMVGTVVASALELLITRVDRDDARETTYQYVPSVVDAVAQALAAEYGVGHFPLSPTGDSVFREPTRRVVAHIAARAQGLLLHVRAHPEIAPTVAGGQPDAFALRAFAAYGGAGTVGVIEEWLRSDDRVDIDTLTDVILAAAPEWWQGRG